MIDERALERMVHGGLVVVGSGPQGERTLTPRPADALLGGGVTAELLV